METLEARTAGLADVTAALKRVINREPLFCRQKVRR